MLILVDESPTMRILPLLFLLLSAPAAMAHHPFGSVPIETFWQGLLSGIVHPILGVGHLAFVLAIGAAASLSKCSISGVFAYILGVIVGCFSLVVVNVVPVQPLLIGISILIVGGMIASTRHITPWTLVVLFAGCGLLQAALFSDMIALLVVMPNLVVLTGHLLGFAISQLLLAFAAGYLVSRWRPVSAPLKDTNPAAATD